VRVRNGETGGVSFSPTGSSPWSSKVNPESGPAKVSTRTLRAAIENALIYSFTRTNLELVLAEELHLTWTYDACDPSEADTKRALIDGYIHQWPLPQLVAFARRLDAEVEISEPYLADLRRYIDAYDRGGGVEGPTKNPIFAANGPKPDIVLRDAVSNDIEIVANAEHCLVYEQPIPAEGLRFSHLIRWWRAREGLPEALFDDRAVGHELHRRLAASLDSEAEKVVFEAYAGRYKASYDIPALIPQVYLHYDPYDQRTRRGLTSGTPLARQRMDFLLLFSDRQRVVIEVDGKQHYAQGDQASPALYSEMVAEDRRLRLAGYEVYRFGGYELTQKQNSAAMVQDFFAQLAERMK
jgi:very-short-patch-repair endonuclease